MTIPKIIIQTWKTKKLCTKYKEWSLTWKKYNPDYKYLLFDDNDCYRFIYNNYYKYIDLYESLSIIEKTDMFRYLVLHYYGGIYVDMDTICFKSLTPLLNLFENSLITGIEYNEPLQYLQWFIACPKNCKIMIELVNEIYKRSWIKPLKSLIMKSNDLIYYTTGPVMYTYVLKNTKESVVVLEKGKLGCYDKNLINQNSYLQHLFEGSWKFN